MPNLQSGMAPVSQSWSKYTKIIWEKVSHSPVYVSHSYHLGVALVGNATPERGFSDKKVSFLWCFSKISNFRFFIIRSCFYSGVVSLFGPSALPGSPGQMNTPSTPSCTIDITQHALKGRAACVPLQGMNFRSIRTRYLSELSERWCHSFHPCRQSASHSWLLHVLHPYDHLATQWLPGQETR